MIDKKDLRIGNSVMNKGIVWEIEELKENDVTLFNSVFGWKKLDYCDINPIPITEEALVKQLKFTKINEKLFCKGRLIVAIQDGKAFFTDDITVINLDGIHHLQNVFYFKHQTELSYE